MRHSPLLLLAIASLWTIASDAEPLTAVACGPHYYPPLVWADGGNLRGKDLPAIRQETMEKILALCDERTQATDHTVFVCGGFREGQVCPEHLWIEDHTAKRTYDTFINQDVRVVKKVGAKGKSFKPGCEATAFKAGEIARVPLNGYTDGQFRSLPKG